MNVVSCTSLLSLCAAAKLGCRNEGDHIHYNVVTKQKLVPDVCFQVCTVPPFLPITVALGITLSKNFHAWLLPLSSLQAYPSCTTPPLPRPSPSSACSPLSCAGTQTSFPLENNNASIRLCTEWCQPRGLARSRPLLQTQAHIHWIHSQQCSTRWMANRDASRSKSPPAAGW